MRKSLFAFHVAGLVFGMAAGLEALGDSPTSNESAKHGGNLFERNCAHCHGNDARGDEGPDLHDLKKSDARISKVISQGIKGEMPAFGSKLNDVDIKALITFLRTLKD